jgi:hypothetical protein
MKEKHDIRHLGKHARSDTCDVASTPLVNDLDGPPLTLLWTQCTRAHADECMSQPTYTCCRGPIRRGERQSWFCATSFMPSRCACMRVHLCAVCMYSAHICTHAGALQECAQLAVQARNATTRNPSMSSSAVVACQVRFDEKAVNLHAPSLSSTAICMSSTAIWTSLPSGAGEHACISLSLSLSLSSSVSLSLSAQHATYAQYAASMRIAHRHAEIIAPLHMGAVPASQQGVRFWFK